MANEYLYLLVRARKPAVVVETGVAAGFSSAYILQGLADNGNGRLYSVDLPNVEPHGRVNADGVCEGTYVDSPDEVGFVVPPELKNRWVLTLGDSHLRLGPILKSHRPIDFFFHDSEHSYSNMLWEYRTVWESMSPGGILASDDIDWNTAFRDFRREVHATEAFHWIGRGAIRKPK